MKVKKSIINDLGNVFDIGDKVTIHFVKGGRIGGCTITKITDKGFWFVRGCSREKYISYDNLKKIMRSGVKC